MYRFSRKSRLGAFAVLAVALLMVTALVPMAADESDAVANGTGTLDVQPGQTWSWTPTFKDGMTPDVTVAASDSEMPADDASASSSFGTSSGYASVSNGTVKVSIPLTYDKSKYYVKVRAQTTLPTQTVYYELTFNTSKLTLGYNVSTVYAKVGTPIADMSPVLLDGYTAKGYSISGDLPAGLDFDTSTGKITGTPTEYKAQAAYNITAVLDTTPAQSVSCQVSIGAYDDIEASDYTVYAIKGETDITVPGVTMPSGTVLSKMEVTVSSNSIAAGTAYKGMTVEANTGKITGTPSEAGTFVFTEKYTATEATGGSTVSRTVTVVVEDRVAITGTDFDSFVGHEDSVTMNKTAGPSAVSWSISKITKDGTQITSGADFDSFTVVDGVLRSGTATSEGTYVVTVKAATSNTTLNTSGATGASTSENYATKDITVTVAPAITLADADFYMAANKVYDGLALTSNIAGAQFSVDSYGDIASDSVSVSAEGAVTPGAGSAPSVGDHEITIKAVDPRNPENTITATMTVHVAYALLFTDDPVAGEILSN